MEHRCSVRKPFELQLLIYKHGLPVQTGVSRNIGLGGVYIETGCCEWRKNECLEVEFLGYERGSMRLPAIVVHQSARGVGLMFDGISNEQQRALRVLLFSTEYARDVSLDEGGAVGKSRAVA